MDVVAIGTAKSFLKVWRPYGERFIPWITRYALWRSMSSWAPTLRQLNRYSPQIPVSFPQPKFARTKSDIWVRHFTTKVGTNGPQVLGERMSCCDETIWVSSIPQNTNPTHCTILQREWCNFLDLDCSMSLSVSLLVCSADSSESESEKTSTKFECLLSPEISSTQRSECRYPDKDLEQYKKQL